MDDPRGVEEFCRSLGAALGRSRHSILVESDKPRTADYSVVAGVLSAGTDRQATVEVFHRPSASPRLPFAAAAADQPDAFKAVRLSDDSVSPTHLRMLRSAHVAVVIGGGPHSYPAGLAAAFMGVRLIPVAAFGGAGALLWQQFADQFSDPVVKLPRQRTWDVLAGHPAGVLEHLVDEIAGLPRIMVVHGRSPDRHDLTDVLGEIGIRDPIVLQETFQTGKTIPEKFEREALQADAAIALFTPDDEAAPLFDADGRPLDPTDLATRLRARQNVSLEYGWFWGRLGRDRVLLLLKGELELPSDMSGLLYECYADRPSEIEPVIRQFIDSIRNA